VTVIPDIIVNNGQRIPQLGFGTFKIPPRQTEAAVAQALQAGYRHIDTAEMYGNEAEVGQAISKSGLGRGEVFVTTKLSNDAHLPEDARRAFERSLKALGFDYVDLFLIHWPLPTRYNGDFVSTWRTLEEFYADGRARSIGVSIAEAAGKTPAQVVLRWHIERGDIVFPKSVTPARIKENIDIFDFELSGQDLEAITSLNRDQRTGPDPDKFDLV